jgi:hypothetical protein
MVLDENALPMLENVFRITPLLDLFKKMEEAL